MVYGYKIKIYAQMLALVYISQIVPYFSLFWQFYGWQAGTIQAGTTPFKQVQPTSKTKTKWLDQMFVTEDNGRWLTIEIYSGSVIFMTQTRPKI